MLEVDSFCTMFQFVRKNIFEMRLLRIYDLLDIVFLWDNNFMLSLCCVICTGIFKFVTMSQY